MVVIINISSLKQKNTTKMEKSLGKKTLSIEKNVVIPLFPEKKTYNTHP